MKAIFMKESYKFYETVLIGGATYPIGSMPGGHELTEARAAQLIEEGFAEEVR